MPDAPYVVQKVEWFQFRAPDGKAFFVMVSTLPNGFVTAVPCELTVVQAGHSFMALAQTASARVVSGRFVGGPSRSLLQAARDVQTGRVQALVGSNPTPSAPKIRYVVEWSNAHRGGSHLRPSQGIAYHAN